MFDRVKVAMNCLKKENRQLLEVIKAMKECWFHARMFSVMN